MIKVSRRTPPGSAQAGEPLRVLVVEHNRTDADLILAHLERGGFAVSADVVATPDELTARLAAARYDVVLSDYRLPGWTAMEALALLRQHGHDTPLIIVTGTLGDEQAAACVKEGAVDYVLKDHLTRLPLAVRRVLAERAMREGRRASEERYRMLFDSSPLPTWVFDLETHAFLAVNQAAVRHYGYSRQEFLAMRIEDLRPLEDVAALHAHLDDIPREVHSAGTWRHRAKDGTLMAVEVTGHGMTWDKRPAELVVAHDITERQRVERALAERVCVAELGTEIGIALTRGRTLPEILQGCCEALVRNLDAAFARIWTLNEPAQMLELQASAGLYTHLDGPHSRVPVGQYKIGLIASERRPHVTNTVIGDPRVSDQEWAKREGMVSFAGYPLLVQGRLVGVMAMFARHRFAEFVRDALATGADSIAVVIERKRAEEAFRESEARFRQLGENVKEVIGIMDGQFRETLYINPAYEQLWGRSCRSLYDNPLSFLEPVPPEDRERVGATIAKAQAGEDPGEIEFRVIRPDGEVRWVLAHPIPIRNDNNEVFRIIATVLDITERKLAEEALRSSEQRMRTLFETVNLIVLGLDSHGKVEYVNPFLLALTGYARDEVLGQDWVERFIPEAQRPELGRLFHELVDHELHTHHQNPILTKAGKERTITWHNTRLKDAQGRGTGTLSIGEDVTEHLQLEQQFRQAQKMEAVGRLAGGVAHDFNNLLTAILGSSELILETLRPDAPEREDVEEIHKAGRRAADLTRQLLAFSRQQVLAPRVLDLNALVANMEKLLQRLIGEDVVLRTALASPLGAVRADPGQIEQVIVNLAVNARDAMPQGGQLTIETSNVDLDEGYADVHFPAKPGSYVLLTVADTGTGMDAETKSHMFEPFFTTKEKGKGTGLGLATLYGIVKQSDGYVWVYSELGRGTAFKIYLPRVTAALEAALQTQAVAPRGTETVLVVEDDEQVRRFTRKMLEARGHTVLIAADGAAAIRLLETHAGPIDLLVTDVVMPGMSGRELVERVAVLRPTVRVLYLSGYTDDAVVRHGVLQAGIAFLQKPFAADALVRKVREVLDAGK